MRRCCFIENRDHIILLKMVNYCDRIQQNLERFDTSFQRFTEDFMFQDACCMCVVQIGELAAQLSDEMKAKNNSIPWRIIKDTRNFYVHAYGNIDVETVWNTLSEDIPMLKKQCEDLLLQGKWNAWLSTKGLIRGSFFMPQFHKPSLKIYHKTYIKNDLSPCNSNACNLDRSCCYVHFQLWLCVRLHWRRKG